jgi:cytoskeletal protein CcmA (bactofilin family)
MAGWTARHGGSFSEAGFSVDGQILDVRVLSCSPQRFQMTAAWRRNVALDMNQPQKEVPGSSLPPGSRLSIDPSSAPAANSAIGSNLSCVAFGLRVEGEIICKDDLQIDGNVEGKIVIPDHRLTVGRSGQLTCNVDAHEVIVYGKVVGNLSATGLIEIKKDASVIGDIRAARISIEDGAYIKGTIDMEGLHVPKPANLRTSVFQIGGITN